MAVQEEEGCLSQGFALIGVITVAYLAITQGWRILCGFRAHFLSHWWKPNLSQYGTWAEQKSGRKTKIIQADFTGDVGIYTPIEEGLKGLDIGILVNNVGMTYSDNAARFLDVPNVKKRVIEVINCNVMSVLHMTNIVLPDMLKKKKGLIINIASEAGTLPYPMIAVYSSTKVFVDYFSRCLQTEYSSQGIRVQSVLPLLVSTNMTFGIKSNIFVKSSDSFAYDALNTVGVTTRTHGCLSHDLQHFFVHLFITDFILSSSATNFFILRATKALEKMGTMKKD
ncbi:hypothetical protein XELAEV_18000924mg [Xenopus laevis]|nr:hypothetical protein XELAEV_18000924mg [Xenopus laevis]